jgi:hypothetical protein
MFRRSAFAIAVLGLLLSLAANAALAQVRVPNIHIGGGGIGPIGGAAGAGVQLPRETLRNSLEIRSINTSSLESIRTPQVRVAEQAAIVAPARASDDYSPEYSSNNYSNVVSPSYSYNDETTNAAGGPPPPVEEPSDGDDGGDDEDDEDEDEDEEEDEEDEEYQSFRQIHSGGDAAADEQGSPTTASTARPFPWRLVIFGIIFAIGLLGFFARKS